MIALSCCGKTIGENLEQIDRYRANIGCAELRVDFLDPSEYEELSAFPERAGLPVILTFRKACDGGQAAPEFENGRYGVLESALGGGYAWVDIEDDAPPAYSEGLKSAAEAAGTAVIRSFHDFNGVPGDLFERMVSASEGGRCIPKAAVMPRGTEDMIRIFETARRLTDTGAGREASAAGFILLGMGVFGFPTRILAGAFGSMLTFASAEGRSAAPGHISPDLLAGLYGYDGLSRDSRVYGIIGRPVMHSKSPELHNRALAERELDAVYVPFETDEPGFLLQNADLLNLRGLSVTIPHKETALSLAGRASEAASAMGASNTLVRSGEDGVWEARNTDWAGFLAPIASSDLEGREALVVGAGGAARAVVYALVRSGMKVRIVNRTAEKAGALAREFGCSGGGLGSAGDGEPPFLVVQTTSVGMSPDVDRDPLPDFDFSGTRIAYDIIYTPEKTRFLSRAEAAGCSIINGMPMLKAQAEEQFRLFTGYRENF